MADDNSSNARNCAPSPRNRAKFPRAQSVTSRPKSSGGGRTSISGRATRLDSQKSQDKDALTENEKDDEPEQKRSRAVLETELRTMTSCYEHANRRVAELEMRSSDLSRKYRSVTSDLENTRESLHDMEKENTRLHRKLTSVASNLDTTKNKLTNMEWKAMEYEKLSILNDNLKTKNENLRQDNRDLERRLKETERKLEETKKELERERKKYEGVNEKMQDLRLQVREEAIKNAFLDKQVDDLQSIRNSSGEKDEQISQLKKKLEETEILLEHARKSWKEEREKVTGYENEDKTNDNIREEVEIVKAENMTLKKLIIAKDSILIQKTRTLDNIRNRLAKCTNQFVEVEVLHGILESKPAIRASFPVGNKIKQEQFGEGNEVQVNGWMNDTARPKSSPSPRRAFFETVLQSEDSRNNNTGKFVSGQHRRPKTAIVKPNNYKAQSFGDFRSSSDIFSESSANKDSNKENNTPLKSSTPKPRRGHENSNAKPHSAEKGQSKMRRTKSVENKMYNYPPEGPFYRSTSPGACSSTRTSSTSLSTVGSTGSASVPAIMLKAAPEKDRQYSRVLRIGDRVYVDMSRSKDKRKHSFHQAVVKFIGNLDKEYDSYRIYMGIKLDEPVGDTDGIYKGKRYFKVAENYGKFVRITRVTSIFDRQKNRFQDIEDYLQTPGESDTDKTPVESQESFQLKL